MNVNAAESPERWPYKVGGISALLLGVSYIAIIPLFAHVGAPPTGGEAWLKYLEGKTTVWWWILGLSVFTDVLFVPVALSLYHALNRFNRYAMLLGTAFVGLFVALDLVVTWTNYASLLTLSGLHSATTNEALRASYLAAASYASAALASPTEVFYAIVDLSLGILIISFVMLKSNGTFGKLTAYLGIATGIAGLATPSHVFVVIMVNALLATIWVLLVGNRLVRLTHI